MLEYVIDRIGKRRPARLYVREWMEAKDINNKTLAGRIGRAESTVSKLLAYADPSAKARGASQKITVEYLAEFADALGLENPADLFRDPAQPSRDELLKGYSNEELVVALQLIDRARSRVLPAAGGALDLPSERPEAANTQKRVGARR